MIKCETQHRSGKGFVWWKQTVGAANGSTRRMLG